MVNRIVFAVVVSVAMFGCNEPSIKCPNGQSDCPAELVCHPTAKVCTLKPDGGSAGGGTTQAGGGTNLSGGGNTQAGGGDSGGGGTTQTGGGTTQMGGGTTQMGGGTTTGGGTAGGSTTCLTECSDFQQCVGTTCTDISIAYEFTSPDAGATIGPTATSITGKILNASTNLPAVGVKFPMLKIEKSGNSLGLSTTDAAIAADATFTFGVNAVGMPGQDSNEYVRISFPTSTQVGLVSKQLDLRARIPNVCQMPCNVGDECVPRADLNGVSCQPASLKLQLSMTSPSGFTNPIVGGPLNSNNRTISGILSVLRADGGTPTGVTLPTALLPTVDAGTPLAVSDFGVDGGLAVGHTFPFSIRFTSDASIETAVSVSANLLNVGVSVPLTVDTQGPSIAVALVPREAQSGLLNGGAFRRDEVASILFGANETLNPGYGANFSSDAGVFPGVQDINGGNCPPPTNFSCQKYSLNLWEIPMNSLSTQISFEPKPGITDPLGNPGVNSSMVKQAFDVTRLRWQVQPDISGNFVFRAAPVLDSTGNVYIGNGNAGNNAGSIYSYQQDGTPSSGWDAGGVSVGSVVSLAWTDRSELGSSGQMVMNSPALYFNSNYGVISGQLGAIRRGVLLDGGCRPLQPTHSSIALVGNVDGGTVGAVATFNAQSGGSAAVVWYASNPAYVGHQPIATAVATEDVQVNSGAPLTVAPFTGSSSNPWHLYIPGKSASGARVSRVAFSLGNIFDQGANSTPAHSGSIAPMSGFAAISGVAHSSAGIFIGMAFPFSSGSFFRANPPGQNTALQTAFSSRTDTASPPVLENMRVFTVINDANGTLINADSQNISSESQAGPIGEVTTSPILGLPTPDGGTFLFAVNNAGEVVVANRTVPASISWKSSGGFALGTTSMPTQPTLSRNMLPNSGASNTGILYFGNSTGWLTSIIVDSPGTDCTSPWPKWQKDIYNSGNTTFSTKFPDGGCP